MLVASFVEAIAILAVQASIVEAIVAASIVLALEAFRFEHLRVSSLQLVV